MVEKNVSNPDYPGKTVQKVTTFLNKWAKELVGFPRCISQMFEQKKKTKQLYTPGIHRQSGYTAFK